MADSRMTLVANVYHQHTTSDPQGVDIRLWDVLASDADPYQRKRLEIGEEPVLLETGWLGGNVGLLVIENHTGKDRQTNPTPAERAAELQRIVRVYDKGAISGCLIRPGRAMIVEPEDASRLMISCLSGTAVISLFAIPR